MNYRQRLRFQFVQKRKADVLEDPFVETFAALVVFNNIPAQVEKSLAEFV
jgi:hypothetical protein